MEMPHLARRLVLVRPDGNRFVPVARLDGVSNHRIGEDFITGGVRDCAAGPGIIMLSADWHHLLRITFENGRLRAAGLGPFSNAQALEAVLACND
ncbi:hypothetical protein [Roseinatronobacter alkalisoli]|uniref:Uncharacterized protein n=1 Tax=Roseinatronobacter alkalisoli TaxID=3028235 RepID=A0ABT5T3M5_9RHOB|nr:hypothetical protein [Roseinatronobacter sp. HJB301]MDD7969639.1 hypothetical protein [Roseinatronobacter sp. HJB301]